MLPRVILAVDDEVGIRRLLKLELASHGYQVVTAGSGEEALEKAEHLRPDLAILDVVLPGMSGLELMGRLRERIDVPVVLLTGLDRDSDKIGAFDQGADDYVVKPFSSDELRARIEAVLRRSSRSPTRAASVYAGDYEIDLARRLVRKHGEMVTLTRIEWLLLQELATRIGQPVSHSSLLRKVWGNEYVNDLQYLRVWIWRLRSKLEEDPAKPRLITTIPGVGYVLRQQPSDLDDVETCEPSATACDAPGMSQISN